MVKIAGLEAYFPSFSERQWLTAKQRWDREAPWRERLSLIEDKLQSETDHELLENLIVERDDVLRLLLGLEGPECVNEELTYKSPDELSQSEDHEASSDLRSEISDYAGSPWLVDD